MMKTPKLIKIVSAVIIIYALGLKFIPNSMPFSKQESGDDFYAPYSSCFQDPEF